MFLKTVKLGPVLYKIFVSSPTRQKSGSHLTKETKRKEQAKVFVIMFCDNASKS